MPFALHSSLPRLSRPHVDRSAAAGPAFPMTSRTRIDRISPLWLGIGISGTLLALLLVAESALGRWDELLAGPGFDPLARVSSGILRDLRLAIVHCLLIGYLPAAFLYVLQSGRRTVRVLQGALDCTREECEALAASVRLSGRGLLIAALIGLALALLTPFVTPPVPPTPWNPSTWSPEVVWHRILSPAINVWVWWLVYAVVAVSLRLSRLARRLNRIDLLDLSPLAPFSRQGLTNALGVIGLLSIASLMLLETGFGRMVAGLGGATLVVATLALLAPARGVHQRIRLAKESELLRVNEAIAARRSALENQDAGRRSGDMADLVAYRGLIESVPEWPFTTSTYARFVLYLLIPVASWVLGVVAEEVVGRALF